ncbi:MAG: ATP-binding cassette domain-containing protein [Bacteroidia bacterium]|nr:ATP-binding cassette domain-containing protein [Bacteroidia bacterium]
MSESILKALMQLFAIIANVETEEGVSSTSRKIVESYLRQQLNKELLEEYLKIYDEFIAKHHKKKGEKRLSSNSVKVLKICEQINDELRQDQKMLVLLQLIEYVSFGEQITDKELQFIQTVAETFNISKEEYLNVKEFIFDNIALVPEKDKLLISDGFGEPPKDIKYVHDENLRGQIVFLWIKSTNMYAFRYSGKSELFLNGRNIKPRWGYILPGGASIRGPKINTVYYSDVASKFLQDKSKSKIDFEAKEIEFKFKNSENGIQRFNFHAESGQLIGVMGGSGAGKSTLLNVFNGNLEPQKGALLINGFNIYTEKEKVKGVIGFVPQDDLLIEELTVYQNLYYNAKLCFDNFNEEEIDKSVSKVLQDLDLYEIRNLKVGGPLNKFISGGQRKRLNIALELIREPSVMFVDEPTSGLSSMDSEIVMDLLKEQSLKGKMVLINIHQPSSDIYKMFDKILIMDKGGHPIYFGNPIDAVTYFKKMTNHVNAEEGECITCGNVNPEQVLQIVEAKVVDEYGKLTRSRKVSSKEWYALYKENIESKVTFTETTDPIPENKFKIPGVLSQFKIYAIRDILSKLTNRQYVLLTFLEAPLLAVILGYFTKYISGATYVFSENENIPAYIFMAVVVSLFLGMTISAEEIIKDKKIQQREQFLNLSRAGYLFSKILIMFTISAIQTFTFVVVGNLILGLSSMNINYWLVLFSASCFANMLGLNISSALNSVVTIYILIPFILVPQLLLSGVIVKFDKLHKNFSSHSLVPVAGDLMTSRWAYEAIMVSQFKDNKYEKYFFNIEKEVSYNSYKCNYLIPELLSKVDKCEQELSDKTKKEDVEENLLVLTNEIKKLLNTECDADFKYLDKMNINSFNTDIAEKARRYLEKTKKFFAKQLDEKDKEKDAKYNELVGKFGKEALEQLKKEYHNESVANVALNAQEIKKTFHEDHQIVQLMNPIFKVPDVKNGRGHMYAPVKRIFGFKIDTFWFNIMFIWLTTVFFFFVLRYDLLKRGFEYLGNVKLIKIFKKISSNKPDVKE